jgi:hypothetical protein
MSILTSQSSGNSTWLPSSKVMVAACAAPATAIRIPTIIIFLVRIFPTSHSFSNVFDFFGGAVGHQYGHPHQARFPGLFLIPLIGG